MKNILKSSFAALLTLVMFSSCEDNEKSPFPIPEDGSFVSLVIDNAILDVTDLDNTAITGTLRAPVANVASYNVQARRTSAGVSSEYVDVFFTDTFPSDLNISLSDLAAALDSETTDFSAGDRFDFQATSTSTDGIVTNFSDLNIDLQGEPGQLQSYQFVSFISCPFNIDEAVGTYEITASTRGDLEATFDIEAGPFASQIVLIDPYGHQRTGAGRPVDNDYNLVIDYDAFSGIVSFDENALFNSSDEAGDEKRQFVWDTGAFFGGFQPVFPRQGSGFFFTCTGTMLLEMRHFLFRDDGALFAYGGFATFNAQKI